MTGDELRALRAVDRGRVPSPRDPALHVLLSKRFVDSGRDGYFVTDLGRKALAGDDPTEGVGLPPWLYFAVVAVVSLGLWLAAGRGWQPLVYGFIVGSSGVSLLDGAVRWRDRRRSASSAGAGL